MKKEAIIIKKTKVNDDITLPKDYTGYVYDETESFYCFYCYEVEKNLLVNKKDIKFIR